MVRLRRWTPVAIALFVSLGVTAVLGMGMLSGGGGGESSISIDRDLNHTPAPTTNITPTGESTNVTEFASFENVATEVGFEYSTELPGGGLLTQSGVYVADYNNDGYEDILAVGGNKPILFRNTGGRYERAQTLPHPETRAAHFLDYDNDGWQELVLAEYAGGLVFYENRNGSFERTDVGLDASLTSPSSITSADITGNGCLDLFIGQNGLWAQGRPLPYGEIYRVYKNHPDTRPTTTPGGENLLYYGDCEAFQDATHQAGIQGKNWTLAVSAADFTGDGYIDIHVGNDFSADFLYKNTGNGSFQRHDLGPETDRNAMSSVAKDITGNGRLDLFVTNIYANQSGDFGVDHEIVRYAAAVPEGNNLLVNTNRSDGDPFVDRAEEHGLHRGGWGWAATVDDFTNDGHLDIIHATIGGTVLDSLDRFDTPQVWQGTSDSWEAVNEPSLGLRDHRGRGLVRLDYDNDGVLDFAIATTPSSIGVDESGARSFALYENHLRSNESLQLLLRNPDGLARNAAVVVETSNRTVLRRVTSRSGFLSQNSRIVHVGTASEEIQEVRVLWPGGFESVYTEIEDGNRYILKPESSERVD